MAKRNDRSVAGQRRAGIARRSREPFRRARQGRQRGLLPPRLRRGASEEESSPAGHLHDRLDHGQAGCHEKRQHTKWSRYSCRAAANGKTLKTRPRPGCRLSRSRPARAASPRRSRTCSRASAAPRRAARSFSIRRPTARPSWCTRAERSKVVPVKLGPDDRVFKLHKADLALCAFVREALTT